ncbi:tape measure protein [Dickeya solani]|uniref:Tape measure protein n=1 Tax=Dickeya solani TaxID=1089444 RepID=A0ABU4EMZ1_9GAMM|nr:tape measure protein [Dickeya solani]MCA6998224.1 tape measure protein [Dickeya solani]MDV6997145.1 tape measure protein [Dickeya solani]MDV7004456.1 tape measure protein [Dickeya solani]MDV7040382.1 tape measure protein [Dickeya solani]MDV7044833.1 tape measure protein [Dickeya solani]
MATKAGDIYYDIELETAQLLSSQQKTNSALDSLGKGFDRTTRNVESTEKAISSLSRVAVALTAALSVQQVSEYANAWTTVNNKLTNALRPNEQLAEVTQRVFDISQQTRSSLDATATLYGRLERATRTAGTSTADLIRLTETINKGLVVSGATSQEASSTMIQLSQALASGVLRGEEFNSISENGSRLAVALADSLGVTMGQLRGMAAQGKLTTDVVVKGLLSQGSKIGDEFAKTIATTAQSLEVAKNNITKFFGESTSIQAGLSVFNGAVISSSENIGAMSGALAAVALVMGGRFVGALTMAAAEQVKATAASISSAKAAAQSAAAAELEAAAQLRLAQANKGTSLSDLNLAQARLNVIRETNAAGVAEVALADSKAASIRTNLAQIEAEKALETQRLRAQISEQGRIATATRMAELQRASTALTAQLATAESAASQARATAIAQAEAQVSSARLAAADASGVAAAANGQYAASQEATIAANKAASLSMGVLRGALGLVGGPSGAAMIAAAAIFYFYQKAQQAKQESIDFADKLDGVIAKMREMNSTQLAASIAKGQQSLIDQAGAISDLRSQLTELRAEESKYAGLAKTFGSEGGYGVRLADIRRQITIATGELDAAENKRSQTASKLGIIEAQANGRFAQGIDLLKRNAQEAGVAAGMMSHLGQMIDVAAKAKDRFNATSLKVQVNPDAQKQIDGLQQQAKLMSIVDKRQRAITEAQDEVKAKGGNTNQIREAGEYAATLYDLKDAESEREKAQREAESEANKAANQQQSIALKLENLREQTEMTAESTRELTREQAMLRAQQSLGGGATDEQIKLAGELAGKKWDVANAIRAEAAAQKMLPEAAENKSYQDDLKDLKIALTSKKISQEQFNTTAERLEQEHQAKLAKIRSQQVVTPTQEALGQVDPVQQLANQHAQQLALIQQFEQQGVLAHENALALRNAADTQYEQQRIAAAWQIWEQQSTTNKLLGSAIDSMSSSASSALTGLINGTQSLQQALANIGSTILNSVISALIEMGMQQVKNAIMGQAAATAALAATTAQATAAASAWAPAAISASIATMGAASTVGTTAYTGALAASKGLAIAGARYNGGPVSAGSVYQVGESGKPEIFKASNGSQYMIPGDNGQVISNRDLAGSSGGGSAVTQTNHFTINTTGGIDDATMAKLAAMMKQVSLSTIKNEQRPNGLLRR